MILTLVGECLFEHVFLKSLDLLGQDGGFLHCLDVEEDNCHQERFSFREARFVELEI
jgi:hypothetical protein